MKRITYDKSIRIADIEWQINTTKSSGCYVEILKATHDQMAAMLSHHSRIIVVSIDLHLHYYRKDNKVVSDFLRKAKKKIAAHYKKYGMPHIGHIWVRERRPPTLSSTAL